MLDGAMTVVVGGFYARWPGVLILSVDDQFPSRDSVAQAGNFYKFIQLSSSVSRFSF